MNCKILNKKISPFMNFGKMPLANGFIEQKDFKNEFFFNMEVGFSEDISLFQLNDHPKPDQMFNKNYPFFSGSSNYMKKHFSNYAKYIKENFIKNNTKLIEIGSNDGTLLENFKNTDVEILGFEPSESAAELAESKNIKTIREFFCFENLKLIQKFKKNTNVICAANAICHVPNLVDLIKSVDELLSTDGVFIFEEPYLGSMFKKISYDQIYDEHIFMFSATSIKKIFNLYDMELVDIFDQPTHGGSMRYIVSRKGKREVSKNVQTTIENEKKNNLDNISSCLKFKSDCELSRQKLKKSLNELKKNNKKIAGYAATSKSTTILNYCEIGCETIDYICDTTKEKIGKFSPGMHIPIVSMDNFHKNIPDIAYLFAWNHKDEILSKEKQFVEKGGKWFSHVSL
tara:strand:- start:49 stop:1248 length:1200 start_codon:yes stop_codon:yes gene_type:complete